MFQVLTALLLKLTNKNFKKEDYFGFIMLFTKQHKLGLVHTIIHCSRPSYQIVERYVKLIQSINLTVDAGYSKVQ